MPEKIILHVLVVGFHHKKGCQLEYSYPPLAEGQAHDSPELPDAWKNLPNLALPDGAHNYDADYVYFILPSADGGKESVYGVSCYRQIDAQALENRTPDITRGSVQKSVVVLSTLPLFGALRTRLELITHAYFEGRDFSKVDLLADTFASLSNCITRAALESQVNCDLSVRELLLSYRHDLLVLVKLLLLERRVVMYHSPASELTSRMLALVSLLPNLLRGGGLRYATRVAPLQMSSVESFVDIRTSGPSPPGTPTPAPPPDEPAAPAPADADSDSELALNLDSARLEIRSSAVTSGENSPSARSGSPADKEQEEGASRRQRAFRSLTTNMSAAGSFLRVKLASAASSASSAVTSVATRSRAPTAPAAAGQQPPPADAPSPAHDAAAGDLVHFDDPRTDVDEFGMPLPIYSQSNLFLPYVTLHNLELLENPAVRSYFIGANNMLYMQKKHLADCFIGSTGSEMWMADAELRRAVQLTAADLRFVDCLLSTVLATVPRSASASLEDQQQQEDVFEGTDWDGSDEWLRLQFRDYLLSLLKAAAGPGVPSPSPSVQSLAANGSAAPDADGVPEGDQGPGPTPANPADFGAAFLRQLRTTRHFRVWAAGLAERQAMAEVSALHPAHGQWKLDDLQLRINHILSHSEQGRKINSAVHNTGKIVQETGKAVGTAITSARSAVSSFWTGISKTATSKFARAPAGDEAKEAEAEPAADALVTAVPPDGCEDPAAVVS